METQSPSALTGQSFSAAADTHMVFGSTRITHKQAERLCWGLGSFRNPAAPLSKVLHHIGYYTLPTKVVNRMDAYRPQKIDSHRWARIRAFVEEGLLKVWFSPGFMPPERRLPSLWSQTRPVSASRAGAADVCGDTSLQSTRQSQV